jgi:hypothetical protein
MCRNYLDSLLKIQIFVTQPLYLLPSYQCKSNSGIKNKDSQDPSQICGMGIPGQRIFICKNSFKLCLKQHQDSEEHTESLDLIKSGMCGPAINERVHTNVSTSSNKIMTQAFVKWKEISNHLRRGGKLLCQETGDRSQVQVNYRSLHQQKLLCDSILIYLISGPVWVTWLMGRLI